MLFCLIMILRKKMTIDFFFVKQLFVKNLHFLDCSKYCYHKKACYSAMLVAAMIHMKHEVFDWFVA